MRGTLPYLLLLFYRLDTFCLGFSVYESLSIHPIYPIYRLYFFLPVYISLLATNLTSSPTFLPALRVFRVVEYED